MADQEKLMPNTLQKSKSEEIEFKGTVEDVVIDQTSEDDPSQSRQTHRQVYPPEQRNVFGKRNIEDKEQVSRVTEHLFLEAGCGDLTSTCEYSDDIPIVHHEEKQHQVERQLSQDVESTHKQWKKIQNSFKALNTVKEDSHQGTLSVSAMTSAQNDQMSSVSSKTTVSAASVSDIDGNLSGTCPYLSHKPSLTSQHMLPMPVLERFNLSFPER